MSGTTRDRTCCPERPPFCRVSRGQLGGCPLSLHPSWAGGHQPQPADHSLQSEPRRPAIREPASLRPRDPGWGQAGITSTAGQDLSAQAAPPGLAPGSLRRRGWGSSQVALCRSPDLQPQVSHQEATSSRPSSGHSVQAHSLTPQAPAAAQPGTLCGGGVHQASRRKGRGGALSRGLEPRSPLVLHCQLTFALGSCPP